MKFEYKAERGVIMERSFGKEIKFYYENKMKKVSGYLKNYWYEILLFLIFI